MHNMYWIFSPPISKILSEFIGHEFDFIHKFSVQHQNLWHWFVATWEIDSEVVEQNWAMSSEKRKLVERDSLTIHHVIVIWILTLFHIFVATDVLHLKTYFIKEKFHSIRILYTYTWTRLVSCYSMWSFISLVCLFKIINHNSYLQESPDSILYCVYILLQIWYSSAFKNFLTKYICINC